MKVHKRVLKQSAQQYRTIKGKRFIMFTSDPALFEQLKKDCKLSRKKYRIIDDQFYMTF